VSILGLIGTSIGGGLCTHCDRLSAVTVTRSAFSPCFWFSDVAPCSDDPDFPDWYVQLQIYDHFMTVSVYDYMNAIANYSADISSWDCVSELTLVLDEPVGGVGEAVCHNWPSTITVTPGVCVGSSDSGLSSSSDSGIEIIGLETASTAGTPASALTIPSFSVSDGLLVVAVAAFAPASAATVAVTFDGTPLTVARQLNSPDSAGDILAVCYLPVSSGTGALVVSLGGVNADIEVACVGILNLADNTLDRVSADANGSSSQPVSNTTLTTTAANEAAIGVFGVRGDVSASIWSGSGLLLLNNAIDGSLGVDVELTVGAAVLGSTQTVFGSLALASPPQPDWFGLVVTFK
jgi:hypothetical protein